MCFEIQNGFSHAAYIIYGSGAYIPRQEVVCERTHIPIFKGERRAMCEISACLFYSWAFGTKFGASSVRGFCEGDGPLGPCGAASEEVPNQFIAGLRSRK